MKIIGVVSRKGGTGKSTLCRTMAVQALIEGQRSAILDGDEQGTCVAWAKRRAAPAPAVVASADTNLKSTLADLAKKKADIAFLDTPPTLHPIVNISLGVATGCIIVTEALPESLETVGSMARIVIRLKKPAAIVITRVPIRTSALSMARSVLTAFEIPVCPIPMSNLIVHSYAAAVGQAAQEREGKGRAADEIKQIWDWLQERGIL